VTFMTRIKRLVVAAGVAVSALAVPFATTNAHAACIEKVVGNGCQPCPPPIVVNGKEIIRFICVE